MKIEWFNKDILVDFCLKNNLNGHEFCKKFDLDEKELQKVLNNDVNINFDFLVKLSQALSVETSALIKNDIKTSIDD